MPGIRCHGQDLVLVAIEGKGIQPELLVPEGFVESHKQCSGLGAQVLCTIRLAERIENLSHADPSIVNVALKLAERLGSLHQRSIRIHDSIARIFPGHVLVANRRARLILLKSTLAGRRSPCPFINFQSRTLPAKG
jgi:hypothetical protein